MQDEFMRVVDDAVEIAGEALEAFDGVESLVVLPALVVLMTEVVMQVVDGQEEAQRLLASLSESVLANLAQAEKDGSASH